MITVTEIPTGRVQVVQNTSTWRRDRVRCATPDLTLVGASRAKKVVVFSQHLGSTLHDCDCDCDGVAVPWEYRVVRWP